LVIHDTTHFKAKAFSFATHVICGMLSLLMPTKRFLGILSGMVALQTMKASPIQPHFTLLTAGDYLVLAR
jgi:hypothetical protein